MGTRTEERRVEGKEKKVVDVQVSAARQVDMCRVLPGHVRSDFTPEEPVREEPRRPSLSPFSVFFFLLFLQEQRFAFYLFLSASLAVVRRSVKYNRG